LTTILDAGIKSGMGDLRKITVEVPSGLLDMAQAETGKGISETVREGLKKLASIRAQKELLALRGKVKFSMTWQEMKEDRE
jgi:Arc/MetJ-type ribon-helix-helix transcriptional regulator